MKCPCHSEKTYDSCCKPFHEGKALPKTPLELMRSRYSAYALNLCEYIIETTHPNHPDAKKDPKKSYEDIKAFCEQTEFINLKIISTSESAVTFHATLTIQGEDSSFIEESTFTRVDGRWYYLLGKLLQKP